MANKIGGLDQVTTTVALSLSAFIKAVKEEIPDVKTVYDEKLAYETASEAFRANNNLDETKTSLYPLFAFRRSVLRHVDPAGPGRRASGILARRNMNDLEKPKSSNIYRLVHGEYDVNFLFITKSIRDLELFEILYMAEEGISSYKELKVDLQDTLGETFSYYVDYQPLEDKIFETDQNVYKMLQGTIKIRGFYPVFRAEAKHILEINADIDDVMGQNYKQIQIIP